METPRKYFITKSMITIHSSNLKLWQAHYIKTWFYIISAQLLLPTTNSQSLMITESLIHLSLTSRRTATTHTHCRQE